MDHGARVRMATVLSVEQEEEDFDLRRACTRGSTHVKDETARWSQVAAWWTIGSAWEH